MKRKRAYGYAMSRDGKRLLRYTEGGRKGYLVGTMAFWQTDERTEDNRIVWKTINHDWRFIRRRIRHWEDRNDEYGPFGTIYVDGFAFCLISGEGAE